MTCPTFHNKNDSGVFTMRMHFQSSTKIKMAESDDEVGLVDVKVTQCFSQTFSLKFVLSNETLQLIVDRALYTSILK